MINDACCVSEPNLCLYVSIEDVTGALGTDCPLTPAEVENAIVGVMCDIDAYVGRQRRADPAQEFEFPRLCDGGCIPYKLQRVALQMATAAAKAQCAGGGGCSSISSDEIKSETNLSHSYVKYDRKSDGFNHLSDRLKRCLDDFRAVSGYLEVEVNTLRPERCCFEYGSTDQCNPALC